MAENININSDLIIKAYKEGNPTEKKLLEKLHPTLFKYEGYKKINSLEAALKFFGLTKADVKITVGKKLQHELKRIQTGVYLDLIADAIRNGREVDYRNKEQKKWRAWFTYNVPSGFGFSYTGYVSTRAGTGVGSRQEFLTSEEAEWFGTKFIDLHRIKLEGIPRKK